MMPPRIATLSTTRLDIRLRQPIAMSFGTVCVQNVVLVRMRDADGLEGLGEASVLGGPHWGAESAEGVQAVIETYLSPFLVGTEIAGLESIASHLARLVRGNSAARGAVEMAAADLLGKRMGMPAVQLLGGPCHPSIPVAWTLCTGSTSGDVEEGERALAERGHRRFKVKLGRAMAAADVARAEAIVDAFRGRASVIADVNGAWDEVMAARFLPALAQSGLEAIEQPLPAGDLAGIARLRAGLGMEVVADEAVTGPHAAFLVAACGGASVLSLKPNRDGGLIASRQVAAVARASGMGVYGGTMLETSLGTAASVSLFATLPDLRLGSELFGPLRLADDIVATPLTMRDGALAIPEGPGFGITLDEDHVAFLARRREPSARHLGAVA